MIKEWFVSLKHIVPSDMEYYLEEKAAQGYMLQEVGETGMFYFEFAEQMAEKCKYVVDITSLPKTMYMQSVIEKGWEYLGKSGNCYIWRKCYKDERPEDFADLEARKKYCKRMGIGMAIITFLFLAATIGLIWALFWENSRDQLIHLIPYTTEAVINLPFIICFGIITKNLFSYKGETRSVIKPKKLETEDSEELDFLKNK